MKLLRNAFFNRGTRSRTVAAPIRAATGYPLGPERLLQSSERRGRHDQLLRILLLLALAAPGLSQSEDEPYFSLSSQRTFGAGGKPSVSLNAWNVDTLEFRVYRVNDPVHFF